MSTSLNELLNKEDIDDSMFKSIMENIMSRPHIIDMKNINDRTFFLLYCSFPPPPFPLFCLSVK